MLRSGFGGTATINGTELPVTMWTLDIPATVVEFYNSLSGNHPQRAVTYQDCTVEIETDYDDANLVFAAPLSIVPGASVTNVVLKQSATQSWSITSMIVRNAPVRMERRGKVVIRIQLAISGGTITPPGGGAAF